MILATMISRSAVVVSAWGMGYLAGRVGVPLPWILGPMLVGAIAALSGHGLAESKLVRRCAQVVVGTAVGHGFTAGILLSLMWQLPWMVLFTLWSLLVAACCSLLLERWGRLDRRTALLANLPGGVAEMAFLGGDTKGASTAIALVQAMRVTSLVILLPFLLSLILNRTGGVVPTSLGSGSLGVGTLIILAVGYAVGRGMDHFGIQNAFIVGALLVSIVDALTGFVGADVPGWLFIGAQIAIGLALGGRFERKEVARMPRLVSIGLLVSLITSVIIIASALLVARPLGISLPVMTLAGAPGGIAEMVITATTLGLGVAEIVAFQTVRIITVNFLAGSVAGLWLRVSASLFGESGSGRGP
ncbi:AbrB family transcriptional regulator [Litchfieldella rifensis]|uniref:AbrB family transcriptional regulator n=1 Tax=Litchfieldella rifensis TaxID=762643 RepID=A0ABV7LLK9_9GAMM